MNEKRETQHREDTTEFGEFVCSAYHWLPLEKQKRQAKKLENITKKKDKN